MIVENQKLDAIDKYTIIYNLNQNFGSKQVDSLEEGETFFYSLNQRKAGRIIINKQKLRVLKEQNDKDLMCIGHAYTKELLEIAKPEFPYYVGYHDGYYRSGVFKDEKEAQAYFDNIHNRYPKILISNGVLSKFSGQQYYLACIGIFYIKYGKGIQYLESLTGSDMEEQKVVQQSKELILPIIPQPQQICLQENFFNIPSSLNIYYDLDCLEMAKILADYFQSILITCTTIDLKQQDQSTLKEKDQKKSIKLLNQLPTRKIAGQYELQIMEQEIIIKGCPYSGGLFYGIQTLKQIFFYFRDSKKISCLKIEDYPQFEWRGQLLDVSRHFFPIEVIKKILDQMAYFKLNKFHWHLIDYQAWRIEIKKYPKLIEIGSNSVKLQEEFFYPGKQYYTQDEIKEIVLYAQSLFIEIIPEFEGPGHIQSLIASYPNLGSPYKNQFPMIHSLQASTGILNIEESTFAVLFDILTEMLALFPSKYVHIGGDEVPSSFWANPETQKIAEKLGLKLEQIQKYYTSRLRQFLEKNNRVIIGWNEVLEQGIEKGQDVVLMAWNSNSAGLNCIQQGFKTIMCCQWNCYFDIYENFDQIQKGIQARLAKQPVNLKSVYNYNPFLSPYGKSESNSNSQLEELVIGTQGLLWTEYVANEVELQFKLFPRMLAIAEVAWTTSKQKNYFRFIYKLKLFEQYFASQKLQYCQDFLQK